MIPERSIPCVRYFWQNRYIIISGRIIRIHAAFIIADFISPVPISAIEGGTTAISGISLIVDVSGEKNRFV